MAKYAIWKLDGPFVSKRLRGEIIAKCNVRFMSPEQAALGPMTDGEVATILIRRKRHEDHNRQFAEGEDNLAMKVADDLGLWPPEVGKDAR